MKQKIIWLIAILIAPILVADCTTTPRSMAYNAPLATAFAAGDSPDMIFVDSVRIGEFIKNGWLSPLPAELAEGLQPELVSAFQYNGNLYALPHDIQPLALMVNPDLFQKFGLTYPQNWDELLKVSQTIHDQGGFGIGLSPGLWNFLPFLYQAGGEIITRDRTLGLNSDPAITAMKFYSELGKTAYISESNWPLQGAYFGSNKNGLLDKFISGEVAMIVVGPGMYNAMRQSCSNCPAEIIPLPEGPAGRSTVAIVRGFGLTPSGMSKGDASIRFLKYAESADGMQYWIGDKTDPLDFIPARPDLQGKWLESHPEGKAFLESITFAHTFYLDNVTVDAIARFDQTAGDGFNNLFQNRVSFEQVLQQLQTSGTDILKQ